MYLLHLAAESISSASASSPAKPWTKTSTRKRDAPVPADDPHHRQPAPRHHHPGLPASRSCCSCGARLGGCAADPSGVLRIPFGNLHISLQSVLVALGVRGRPSADAFRAALAAERVFVGRHSESGLQESIKIGIGYLGFVLGGVGGRVLSRLRLQHRDRCRYIVRRYRLRSPEHLQQFRLGAHLARRTPIKVGGLY